MPDAVEAADYGGFRGHEGVAHPNGEDGVLLTERLAGRNCADGLSPRLDFGRGIWTARLVTASDKASQDELQDAAYQRYKRHIHEQRHAHRTMYYGLGRAAIYGVAQSWMCLK